MSTVISVRVSEDMAQRLRTLAEHRPGGSVSQLAAEMIGTGVARLEDLRANEQREFLARLDRQNAWLRKVTGVQFADELEPEELARRINAALAGARKDREGRLSTPSPEVRTEAEKLTHRA